MINALKILILDDESQGGAALLGLFGSIPRFECRVIPASLLSKALDGVAQRIKIFAPDIIVNTYSIDLAQSTRGLGRSQIKLLKMLCRDAKSSGAALIHVSSALVFDGARGAMFAEDDRPRPRRSVSRRLAELERTVERYSDKYIILRTGWIFSPRPNAAFATLLRRLDLGEDIALRSEVLGAPTPASDVARVIFAIILQLECGADCWGNYHYTSADSTTSREFVETVTTLAAQYGELDIDNIRLEVNDRSDPLGVDCHPILDCSKILGDFGIKQRPWRSAMTTTLKTIYRTDPPLREPV